MTPEGAEGQLAALPADVRASFGVFDATLTVFAPHGEDAGAETPWGRSRDAAEVNGFEANLLLFLLDAYRKDVASGARPPVPGYADMEALAPLRDRLFESHEHPAEADGA